MQKINLIAQGVLELSHRENADDDNDDTHQGWIIVRDGMYSVADKKADKANDASSWWNDCMIMWLRAILLDFPYDRWAALLSIY